MTLVPMRFKNYEWRYNPEEISFECEKNIQELNSPKNTAYIQNLGKKQAYKRKRSALRRGLP
mgnify:CR=1 FL=1